MSIKNLGWFVAAGLAVALAWGMCSRPPAENLSEDQKRGLELLAEWQDPDSLGARKATAQNGLSVRVLDDLNLEARRIGLYPATEALNAEFDRRLAGGELTEELVSWYESETSQTDAEIVARWKPSGQ